MTNDINSKDLDNITIESLLCRDPVSINMDKVLSFIKDKRVLVTGAVGSIGSELVRQVAKFEPESIILFDHNESNTFFLEKELKQKYPKLKIICRLGSVCDSKRVKSIFEETMPNIVYHAAANKHVSLSEINVSETIQNNIKGTHIIADAASDIKCDTFVMVSTDKAVNPTSVMGATKRIAELYIQLKAKVSKTNFVIVRFGNVLGSSGSVVPIFKAQIAAGGPVTVTHPDVYRYFMTIPEASQLILQSSTNGATGEIYLLDMGEPVKIIDLAINMIKLSGLQPHKDIKIVFSGLCPGEKIREELLCDDESVEITDHPKIKVAKIMCPSDDMLNKILNLESFDANTSGYDLKIEIAKLIPESNLDKSK